MARRLSTHIEETKSIGDVHPLVSGAYAKPEERSLKILVMGDCPLVAEGIKSIVEQMERCGEALYASDPVVAINLLQENSIDLVLLDLADGTRIETLTTIRDHDQTVPVIVLSLSESAGAVRKAINAGASGYFVESAPLDFLKHAIGVAATGKRLALLPLDSIAAYSADEEATTTPSDVAEGLRDRYGKLSAQEAQVLAYLREGKANKEIALTLGIVESTVKVHVKAILRKLNAKNRTVAALMAAAAAETRSDGAAGARGLI